MFAMSITKPSSQNILISNTSYQLIGKALSMLITVLATVVIAKTYGRASYGEFNLMQNWPAFVFIIVDFGLNAIATREISKDWLNAEKYYNTILLIRLILSAFMIAGLVVILHFVNYDIALRNGITLNLLLILTQALYATTNILFQSKLRYDLSTIGYITGYIFILTSILIMAKLHVPVMWISFTYVVGGLITFIVNSYFIRGFGIHINFSNIDFNFIKTIMFQSLPLGMMFVFSQINFKSDALILSVSKLPTNFNLNNTESVAVYGLAYKIFEVALVLPTFFMNAAYPILVKHMLVGKEKLKSSLIKVLLFLFLSGVIISLLGIVLSPYAVRIIGGKEFGSSILVLQLLVGGLLIYYLTQPLAWLIVTLDRQKYLPWIYLFSAIVNVLCNLIFIPKYSFYGSAIITHISELLILILLIVVARKSWLDKYG